MTMAESNKPFAEGLRKIIEQKGLKQICVAEKAGYKAQEFSDMLNGRRLIKACDIPKLTLALGVEINDIYAAGMEGGD